MSDDAWKLELQRAVGRIEGKLDQSLDDTKDHGTRIRGLERKMHWWSGIAAAIGVAIGYVTKQHA